MATYETVGDNASDVLSTTIRSSGVSEFIPVNLEETDNGIPILIRAKAELIDGIMGLAKGGTGIDSLKGKRLIASNTDGTSFEEVDVLLEHLSGLHVNIQDKLDSLRSFSVDVPTDNWTSDSNGYSKEVIVNDIKSTDNPIIGLITRATSATDIKSEKYAYSCIDRVVVNDNSVVFQCFDEIPSTNISLLFVCV